MKPWSCAPRPSPWRSDSTGRPGSPKTGKRMSLRKITAALTEAGHLNERGQPFNPKSVRSMLDQKG